MTLSREVLLNLVVVLAILLSYLPLRSYPFCTTTLHYYHHVYSSASIININPQEEGRPLFHESRNKRSGQAHAQVQSQFGSRVVVVVVCKERQRRTS